MHEYLLFSLGVLPLLVMILLILKIKMPIHQAVLITLLLTWPRQPFSGIPRH